VQQAEAPAALVDPTPEASPKLPYSAPEGEAWMINERTRWRLAKKHGQNPKPPTQTQLIIRARQIWLDVKGKQILRLWTDIAPKEWKEKGPKPGTPWPF
jgi:hypothetical protein